MIQCRFKELLGCNKCPYEGNCYDEDVSSIEVKQIDYDEEFRKALPVIGE